MHRLHCHGKMPYGFVQRACAPARSIHVGAWAGVAVPRVDGHGAVSGAAYEALHTGRLLGAVERACLGVPSRAAHTAPQRQRTASSACSPQAILWRPPHTLARGVRHCQPGAIPPRSAPPDNPLLRAGCWREREQHLAAGLRHCACAPLPPTSLVCVTRPLTARQCAAAAAHAHQIVSPLTARSCPSKPELLPARPSVRGSTHLPTLTPVRQQRRAARQAQLRVRNKRARLSYWARWAKLSCQGTRSLP